MLAAKLMLALTQNLNRSKSTSCLNSRWQIRLATKMCYDDNQAAVILLRRPRVGPAGRLAERATFGGGFRAWCMVDTLHRVAEMLPSAIPDSAIRRRIGDGARESSSRHWLWRSLERGRVTGLTCGVLLAFSFGARAEPVSNAPPTTMLDPAWGVGAWIWDTNAFAKQTCRFWRSFTIPAGATVARARFRITADNGFRFLFDGREIGRGSDWRSMTEYDLTWLLRPGKHVLAVEGFNDRLEAGILAGLKVELMDGAIIEIPSDRSWRVVSEEERGWEHRRQAPPHWPSAVIVGAFGAAPWVTKPLGVTLLPPLRPVELHFWQNGWFQVLLLSVCAVAVWVSFRLMTRLAVQSKAQEMLHRERARIARDIHDELGAGLTQLLLLGEVAQKESLGLPEGRTQIERLCLKARGLSASLDEVIWLVNSRRDTLRDFASHACKFAQSFLDTTQIRCRLDVESGLPSTPFDLPVRRNLFLAVKEALNNAAKYSAAGELFLRIHRQGTEVVVVVEDTGRGFDPVIANRERNGLTNMAQRMAEIGGRCDVVSEPGKGCKVTFRVPLENPRSGRFTWLARPLASPLDAKSEPERSASTPAH